MVVKLLAILGMVLFVVACGGGSSEPTPVPSPIATATATPTPTNSPQPPTETPTLTEAVPSGFADVAACLEESLGSEVARALVSGSRQETPEEEAVLDACLLITASGVSAEDLTPSVAACLEERLGSGVVEVVGSGARPLTAEEEVVLLDCLVTSALETTAEAPDDSFEGCLEDRLGADLALVVASRSLPLNAEETAALSGSGQTTEQRVVACLAEQMGADIAPVIAARAIPLTDAEEVVLEGCLLAATLEASAESSAEAGDQTLSAAVIECLEQELGEDIAAVVASGAIPLSPAEEEIRGECILGASLDASSEAVSQSVFACLEEELGADLAAVVASGAIPLSEEEARIMGDCVLREALGSSP